MATLPETLPKPSLHRQSLTSENKVLGIILAGGKGTRLAPLTNERSKPAVPFGGKYRIVDFVLSNFINSRIYSIYVLTQFKAQSLLLHLQEGWQFSAVREDHFIIPVPAQMRKGESWYEGTSDAIFQNIHLVELANPDIVAVFGADHIYRMDIRQMIAYHIRKRAQGTVAALPIPVEHAREFGTVEINSDWRIIGFHEKVPNPPEIPNRPGWTLASMGNYTFETKRLLEELYRDAEDAGSEHDFGKNMLPDLVNRHPIYAYDFLTNEIPGEAPENRGYWRDVGTIDAYYEANMDLRSVRPSLNLYNDLWPLRTAEQAVGPSKFTFDEEGRRGQAINSVVAEGCILAGAEARDSVLGQRVKADNGASIIESVVMDNAYIGKGARIRRAIVDKNADIPDGARIGYNLEQDRASGLHVTDSGIVVVEGHRSPIPVAKMTV